MRGLIVALYLALIAPILGFGVSISLTKGLYIPTFIASVIAENKLYLILVSFLMLVFLSVGIANLFILHGIVIDKMSVKEASLQSGELIHENWKDYLKQNVLYIGAMADLLATPLYIMKMTQLFYSYKEGAPKEYPVKEAKRHPPVITAVIAAAVMMVVAAAWMNSNFDRLFPTESKTKIVAHRGGGVEGAENAVSGAHEQNKKLMVWTPNEKAAQKHFLRSSVDGLITDKVVQAVELQKEMKERSDFQRIVDRILTIVS